MTSNLEPCPLCASEVRSFIGLNTSEDVRYMEVECDCGLDFHAESRVIRGGRHDEAAEVAELEAKWNTRAAVTPEQFALAVHNGEAWTQAKTCEMTPYENTLHYMAWLCSECNNLTMTLTHKPCFCAWCGAKAVV